MPRTQKATEPEFAVIAATYGEFLVVEVKDRPRLCFGDSSVTLRKRDVRTMRRILKECLRKGKED